MRQLEIFIFVLLVQHQVPHLARHLVRHLVQHLEQHQVPLLERHLVRPLVHHLEQNHLSSVDQVGAVRVEVGQHQRRRLVGHVEDDRENLSLTEGVDEARQDQDS